MPHEESKNGLGFEIGPSYDDIPTKSQCATEGQSSCSPLSPTLTSSSAFKPKFGSCLVFFVQNPKVRPYCGTRKSTSRAF